MAFEIDTATNYLDLLARVEAFAVANGWTSRRSTYNAGTSTDGELILEGEGLSATDAIVVGVQTFKDVAAGRYNFRIRGFTGWDGAVWNSLPGPSAERYVPLWQNSIPYWLMVNAQRILLMAKCSTFYHYMHLGFIDTYSTDDEYPYPLMIGGTASSSTVKYSDATPRAFWGKNSQNEAELIMPSGLWVTISNISNIANGFAIMPWRWGAGGQVFPVVRDGFGVVPLVPAVVTMPTGTAGIKGTFGQVDGMYWAPGPNISVEDIITIGGTDYVIGHDVFRGSTNDHVALRLA